MKNVQQKMLSIKIHVTKAEGVCFYLLVNILVSLWLCCFVGLSGAPCQTKIGTHTPLDYIKNCFFFCIFSKKVTLRAATFRITVVSRGFFLHIFTIALFWFVFNVQAYRQLMCSVTCVGGASSKKYFLFDEGEGGGRDYLLSLCFPLLISQRVKLVFLNVT